MAERTKIEWTHRPGNIPATMNALVGCQKVSDGCRNCYAIDVAHVRAGNPLPVMQEKFGGTTKREGGKTLWTGKVTLSEKALLAPLSAKKPRTYFVNSMSDLFYDGVPDEWIDRHFAVFALCPQHTFIVLTKRPERMLTYIGRDDGDAVIEPFIATVTHTGGDRIRSIDEPLATVTRSMGDGVAAPALVSYYGTQNMSSVDEPTPTVTTKDRFGLMQPTLSFEQLLAEGWTMFCLEVRFRMLQPRELARAQGFDDSYQFTGNREAVVKQIGNAVPPPMARALCAEVLQ